MKRFIESGAGLAGGLEKVCFKWKLKHSKLLPQHGLFSIGSLSNMKMPLHLAGRVRRAGSFQKVDSNTLIP